MLQQLKLRHGPDQNIFDTWLWASSSLSLCGSFTSSCRKLCTCKLLQVQSFIIVCRCTYWISNYFLKIYPGNKFCMNFWKKTSSLSAEVYYGALLLILRQRLLGLTPLSVTNSDIAQSNYLHSMYIGNISLANKNDQLQPLTVLQPMRYVYPLNSQLTEIITANRKKMSVP